MTGEGRSQVVLINDDVDDAPAVAMADENDWPGLSVDLGPRKLDVFGKRSLRVLHNRHRVPVLPKDVGDCFS